MEQVDVDEIINHINQKFNENVPSLVKMVVRKKIGKLQSFNIELMPNSLRTCTVEDLISVVKYGLESGKLKL
ncbi:MAG: hypothetical protein JKX99_09170 [Robiginitomaculum sp.]|nr:hypothetical protein [Robiginitomaculum sp.]